MPFRVTEVSSTNREKKSSSEVGISEEGKPKSGPAAARASFYIIGGVQIRPVGWTKIVDDAIQLENRRIFHLMSLPIVACGFLVSTEPWLGSARQDLHNVDFRMREWTSRCHPETPAESSSTGRATTALTEPNDLNSPEQQADRASRSWPGTVIVT